MEGSGFPPAARDARRFLAGNTGRPLGTQGRMSTGAARAILRDFEEEMDELLPRMRRWFLPQYVALVGRLLPGLEQAGGGELGADEESETARVVADVRAALAKMDAGEGALADLESTMLGEGRPN